MPADQMHPEDLAMAVASGNAETAAEVVAASMCRSPMTNEERIVTCVALFMGVCDAADIDYEATLSQVVEAIEREQNSPRRSAEVIHLH